MSEQFDQTVKNEFSHIGSLYFNSAYFGPSPIRSKQKVQKALHEELDPSFYPYNVWVGNSDRIRALLSDVINVPANNIAHSTSVTDLNAIIANGYNLQKDDVVVSIKDDYPSNILTWMLAQERGEGKFELLDTNAPDADYLAANLPTNTKIFNVSHVAFNTGLKIDLISIGKLLRERDILFVVDATQSLGGLALTEEELSYIDVLTCSAYKWMLGPYGYGFGVFSEKAQKLIRHTSGNWLTSTNSKSPYDLLKYTTETLPGAKKYDRGQTPNMLPLACLEGSLELFKELGLTTVQAHNEKIRNYFLDHYPASKYTLASPGDRNMLGNIVTMKSKSLDPLELERELKHHNIDVSVREGNIRLSFHLFNTIEQVEVLIKALDS